MTAATGNNLRTMSTNTQRVGHERTELIAAAGSADVESDEAWALYVYENHICQDGEEIGAANYWHKLDDETQGRYLRRIRDAKQNTEA